MNITLQTLDELAEYFLSKYDLAVNYIAGNDCSELFITLQDILQLKFIVRKQDTYQLISLVNCNSGYELYIDGKYADKYVTLFNGNVKELAENLYNAMHQKLPSILYKKKQKEINEKIIRLKDIEKDRINIWIDTHKNLLKDFKIESSSSKNYLYNFTLINKINGFYVCLTKSMSGKKDFNSSIETLYRPRVARYRFEIENIDDIIDKLEKHITLISALPSTEKYFEKDVSSRVKKCM